jgi:ferredoxin
MAIPIVDYELCVGCETCATVCPEVFEMRNDGKAYVIGEDKCNTCNCQDAIDSCPSEAITWGEE